MKIFYKKKYIKQKILFKRNILQINFKHDITYKKHFKIKIFQVVATSLKAFMYVLKCLAIYP